MPPPPPPPPPLPLSLSLSLSISVSLNCPSLSTFLPLLLLSFPFLSLPFLSFFPFYLPLSLPIHSLPFLSLPFLSLPFLSLPILSLPIFSLPIFSLPFLSRFPFFPLSPLPSLSAISSLPYWQSSFSSTCFFWVSSLSMSAFFLSQFPHSPSFSFPLALFSLYDNNSYLWAKVPRLQIVDNISMEAFKLFLTILYTLIEATKNFTFNCSCILVAKLQLCCRTIEGVHR